MILFQVSRCNNVLASAYIDWIDKILRILFLFLCRCDDSSGLQGARSGRFCWHTSSTCDGRSKGGCNYCNYKIRGRPPQHLRTAASPSPSDIFQWVSRVKETRGTKQRVDLFTKRLKSVGINVCLWRELPQWVWTVWGNWCSSVSFVFVCCKSNQHLEDKT